MEYRNLGRSGVQVSSLGLGTMMFGGWGDTDQPTCTAMVDRALEAGINFFDTADVYDLGTSEVMLGKALAGRRDDVVLATKAFNPMGDDPNKRGLSRRWLTQAVDASLSRLGTDRIDLFQLHRPDPATAPDETFGALDDLIAAGKILAVGTSTFPANKLVEAQWACARGGFTRPCAEQPPYSILARGVEAEVLPTCVDYGLGAVVWGPLNGGWLTGKYASGAPGDSRATRNTEHFDHAGAHHEQKMAIVAELEGLAQSSGCTLLQLAIGFVLAHPAVASAIIGPRTPAQLDDLLAAGDYRPGNDVLDLIDTIVEPGRNVNPADDGYANPHLLKSSLRRQDIG
jgi:aryl-alcohol dehydrogenase-like predicted oxidoreductase